MVCPWHRHLVCILTILSVISEFLPAYSHPVEGDDFRRLLTPALNNSKSSNAFVRSSAIALFRVLINLTTSPADVEHAVSELLSLPKAGKTAGPDHRVTLYTMLGAVPPSESVSLAIVQTGLPLLAKETHDASVAVLAKSLAAHLVRALRAESPLPSDSTSIAAKEMTGTKPVVRRAFCSLIGSALWELDTLNTAASSAFAKVVVPSFETNLKTVAANPLGAVAGPLEGYVATAVLLGPLSRSKQIGSSSISFPRALSYIRYRQRHFEQCYTPINRVREPEAILPSLGEGLSETNHRRRGDVAAARYRSRTRLL